MKKILLITINLLLLTGCSNVIESNTKVASSLSDAYKNYFDIGVAVTANNINSLVENDLLNEYNTFTAEYEMKWDQVQLTEDTYNFTNCDSIVNFAIEHDKTIRGHTLIWRTNVPKFIEDIEYSNLSTEEKIDKVFNLVKEYYITMTNRYGEVINVWDVANEVIEDYNDYMYRHDNIYFQLCDYNDELFEKFIA
ncbi:MAG: endo-1,4-beta-xylanase, partial [bacterium]